MKPRKVLHRILGGSKNIRFKDVERLTKHSATCSWAEDFRRSERFCSRPIVGLAEAYGVELSRVAGGDHILVHPEIDELLNLQEVKGKAKPYQIRQLLKLVEQYDLTLRNAE